MDFSAATFINQERRNPTRYPRLIFIHTQSIKELGYLTSPLLLQKESTISLIECTKTLPPPLRLSTFGWGWETGRGAPSPIIAFWMSRSRLRSINLAVQNEEGDFVCPRPRVLYYYSSLVRSRGRRERVAVFGPLGLFVTIASGRTEPWMTLLPYLECLNCLIAQW